MNTKKQSDGDLPPILREQGMSMDKLPNQCEVDGCDNPKEGGMALCASHSAQLRKLSKMLLKEPKPRTPIAKTSKKTRSQIVTYSKEKAIFIKGKICPVYPLEPVEDIHHQKGRVGFADQWARSKGITLLMDKRFWLAVSRKGHDCIETHPSLARAKGWSLSRTEIIQEQNPTV